MNPNTQQHDTNYSVFVERIDSEIKHINILIDTRLESLKTLMDQRMDFLTANSKKDLENLTDKVQDAIQEMRNYKEILQQQLVLLDSAVKSAHQRLDNLQIETDNILSETEAYKRVAGVSSQSLKEMQSQVEAIQTQHLNEALITKVKKENPIRVFFTEQIVKKFSALLAGTIISYIVLNLRGVFEFLAKVFTRE